MRGIFAHSVWALTDDGIRNATPKIHLEYAMDRIVSPEHQQAVAGIQVGADTPLGRTAPVQFLE
jgi:hypothetical protein